MKNNTLNFHFVRRIKPILQQVTYLNSFYKSTATNLKQSQDQKCTSTTQASTGSIITKQNI